MASMAPRPAILGLNGDLGMLVKAGKEGKDDGWLQGSRICCHQLRLHQINSCLDHLVENNHLHARLQELLESNQQTLLELQPLCSRNPQPGPNPDSLGQTLAWALTT